MSFFPSLAAFFKRHKKKIIFTSAAALSSYLVFYQLVIKRFRNFQNALKQELQVKEQIKRRFIQTQTDCYLTVLALLPVLTRPLMSYLPTETITSALKRKKNPARDASESLTTENLMAHSNENSAVSPELLTYLSKSKLELWNDLKIKSITRVLGLIHAMSGLLLLTRLQLNILARRSYLELAIILAGGSLPSNPQNSYEYFIEQSYLSLSWWLLHHGWRRMANKLEGLVEDKFHELNPKTELSVDTFRQILIEVSMDFADSGSQILHLIFPVEYDNLVETLISTNPELVSELEHKQLNLVKLINETNYILANDFTTEVFRALVINGVDTLCMQILAIVNPNNNPGQVSKLATYLAQLTIQSNVLIDPQNFGQESGIAGNPYINNINNVEKLDEFSASIYSNFD